MRAIGLILPPVYLVVALILFYIKSGAWWGKLPLELAGIVNFAAIWLLVGGTNPDYFFLCVALSCLIGLVWVAITILRVFDLLIKRFYRQYGLIIGAVSILWWGVAIVI
ncbi:hypothetical protein PQ472_07005 [Lacticaseibacillus pabuli]|uniref:DUF3397 domain-containing protein n=1 Tax=Lacticaseibacillus pabuli TaxID=3025672 RepID=A0ABY7WN99_9LACO|nr:hypothetical protein [Lacticaseibacillus sp. KACC 23028]WDF81678.1 hypothetical protein PQ472_07005 [Lacticaseibacillus sp. KACC 23028]